MQKLLAFISDKRHWLLLILIQVLCLGLYLNDGLYSQGLKFYASSWLTGHINEWVAEAYSYADLQRHNQSLLAEHARLEQELVLLRRRVADAIADKDLPTSLLEETGVTSDVLTLTARIVNMRNEAGSPYYIIDKGRKQGVKPDMPVMSAKGVVGAVLEASENYAVIVPIINPKVKLSTMVKDKAYQGHLNSLGYNQPTYFAGVSLQADIKAGDTILTSGYSYLYPQGLMVGVVEEQDQGGAVGAEAAFGAYRLRLNTDFDKLRYVYILLLSPMTEARALEDSLFRKDD